MREKRASDQKAAEAEALADEIFRTLPPLLRDAASGVAIRVVDFPDEETTADFGLESPYELLGLYRGVSLDRKSTLDVPLDVDMVFLYLVPIEAYCAETGEAFAQVLRHVLIHEIGHHFGFSDADMAAIEDSTDDGG
ncbi:MAG: metallopeptidase family protein [Alphaproteobacteria bacterium]